MFKKVVLGVSGGVDSAVAALLLKKKGFDVHGVFMKNWDVIDETGICKADEDFKDASYLCKQLNIPLHPVNFVKEYWNEVFCNLIKEYENGCTPNPDILCNRNVKFNYFYKYATEHLKADAIATGHYARTNFGPYLENYHPDNLVKLLRANDTRKDQTFFLCQISQKALRKTMFPLSNLMKWEVKHMAVENNLEKFAVKPESMGICFIGSRNFQHFIKEYIMDKPGDFIDIDTGKIIGHHKGLHQWTLGQRSRLGGFAKSYFVAKKSTENNNIYVASGTAHPAFHSTTVVTSEPHWISSEPPELVKDHILHCDFKFQHTEQLASCKVCKTHKGLVVTLEKHKRALTAGQYAVFYRNNECLGSARILNSGASNFSLFYINNNKLGDVIDKEKNEKENSEYYNDCNLYMNRNKVC